jgi:ubiquinone/menaquinone biosynthesis C-methylase UbiE
MDPEGTEAKSLHSLVDFSGKSVLEVGCGEGRLTWQYAQKARKITAIDPESEKIATAIKKRPKELENKLEFLESTLLEFKPDDNNSKFDVVLLSWSLCCMEAEDMLPGLERAYEILNTGGLLIDIHPYGESEHLEIHSANKLWRAGRTQDKNNYLVYKQADEALQKVIEKDMFIVESECSLPLLNHYDNMLEFEEWIAENWNDTSIDQKTLSKARKLEKEIGTVSEVIVREKVSFASLRPNVNYNSQS